jgi:hypothetical protein
VHPIHPGNQGQIRAVVGDKRGRRRAEAMLRDFSHQLESPAIGPMFYANLEPRKASLEKRARRFNRIQRISQAHV